MIANGKRYILVDKYMYCAKDVLGAGAFGEVYKGYYVPVPGQSNEVELAIKKTEFLNPDKV
jgi:hypothetical protein